MTLVLLFSSGVHAPPSAGPYHVPDGVGDDYRASLPYHEAQMALAEGVAPTQFRSALAELDWHGTTLTTNTNYSTALVRSDGPLADLVGERIRLSANPGGVQRHVLAWVEGASPALQEDLSVTRRLMCVLAPLAADRVLVFVEVLV